MRAWIRYGSLAAIALLYVVSVPWYRGSEQQPQVILGLPDWVSVALWCYVGVAVLNAIAWATTDVPEVPDAAERGRPRSPETER